MRWSLLVCAIVLLGCQTPQQVAVAPTLTTVAATSCAPPRSVEPDTADAQQIADVFADVKAAWRDGSFCLLPLLVDSETVRVYEVLRQRALNAGREVIEIQPLVDQILILEMRQRFGTRLREMTGAEVLAAGVEPPLYVLESLAADVELGEVRVGDAVAFATASHDGTPSRGIELRFVEEDGGWKLDLLWIARAAEPRLMKFADRMSPSRNQFIIEYLTHRSGTTADERIWRPIGD